MPANDKPNAERLGWTILETTEQPVDARFALRRDRIHLPNGVECTYNYPVKGAAVFVVPVTSVGEIVLIRQYRYIIDTWLWEIPAGSTHDFHGDDYRELARRELWEEVGGQTDAIYALGRTFCAPGFTTMEFFGYLALDVRLSATNDPEAAEVIEVRPTPIPQALDLLRQGEHTSAIDAYFVLQQEPLLRALYARLTEHQPVDDLIEPYVKRQT